MSNSSYTEVVEGPKNCTHHLVYQASEEMVRDTAELELSTCLDDSK